MNNKTDSREPRARDITLSYVHYVLIWNETVHPVGGEVEVCLLWL